MKKCLLVCMLVISMSGNLFAQTDAWNYIAGRSKTEQLFDVASARWLRHRFVIALKNGNSVRVLVASKAEFERLLNLDSIVRAVAKNLALFKDSLQDEVTQKRVDYLNDLKGPVKIRILEYPPLGNSFVLGPDGPSLLKVEQDTLNVLGYLGMEQRGRVDIPGAYINVPYKIIFLINDINKLESLADGTMNTSILEIKKQWDGLKKWTPDKNQKTNLYAYYDVVNPRFNRTLSEPIIKNKIKLEPYVQLGLQNVNGLLATSTGVGFEIINQDRGSQRHQFFWEPYFFFDKPANSKFKMRRNDFVTFQFITSSEPYFTTHHEKVEFNLNFSVGYLVHRAGDYFKESTFKAGLPGAKFKFLTLHPEFIFNGLFKDFQPGLKLFLDLD